MIKFYTALTSEIDEPEEAAREILMQLDPEKNALKNTIGIIFFYRDFAKGDIWKRFIDAMPFEIAGCASPFSGACGQHGEFVISVIMFTSDDCYFSVRTVDDMDKKGRQDIKDEITKLGSELYSPEKPKMVMPFLPPIPHYSINDIYLNLNTPEEDVKLFGMQVFNIIDSNNANYVLGNGKMSDSMCAFVAFYGNFKPEFHIGTSFKNDRTLGEEAEITESVGAILKSVNGIPALEYFRRKGLISSDNAETSMMAIPARLTYANGSKVGCAFLGTVRGTEYVFAARSLERGAKITLSYLESEETLLNAENQIKEVIEAKRKDILIFISAARVWSLGSNFFAELQRIAGLAKELETKNGEPFKYSAAYAGSELCPVPAENGNYVNMSHNYTFAICSFNSGLNNE